MAFRYLTPFLIIAAAFVIDMASQHGDVVVASAPAAAVTG
jgi:hypothetical protein